MVSVAVQTVCHEGHGSDEKESCQQLQDKCYTGYVAQALIQQDLELNERKIMMTMDTNIADAAEESGYEGHDPAHEGDEEEVSLEGHGGDEDEVSLDAHEGDDEVVSLEVHEGDDREGSPEGEESDESQSSETIEHCVYCGTAVNRHRRGMRCEWCLGMGH